MTSGVDTFTQVIIVCRTLELRLRQSPYSSDAQFL